MNRVKEKSFWTKNDDSAKVPYRVIGSDYDGVVATTPINLANLNALDSFIWFSPVDDFLAMFTFLKGEK